MDTNEPKRDGGKTDTLYSEHNDNNSSSVAVPRPHKIDMLSPNSLKKNHNCQVIKAKREHFHIVYFYLLSGLFITFGYAITFERNSWSVTGAAKLLLFGIFMLLQYIIFIFCILPITTSSEQVNKNANLTTVTQISARCIFFPIINTAWLWKQSCNIVNLEYPQRKNTIASVSMRQWIVLFLFSIVITLFSFIPLSYWSQEWGKYILIATAFLFCLGCYLYIQLKDLFGMYYSCAVIIVLWILMPPYYAVKFIYQDYSIPLLPMVVSCTAMCYFLRFIKNAVHKNHLLI